MGILLFAGACGVDVFFLLSGFLLFETVYKQVLYIDEGKVGRGDDVKREKTRKVMERLHLKWNGG